MSTPDTARNMPERPPVPVWQWLVMLAAPVLALGLWRLLPDSPLLVALLAITVLAAVFLAISLVLRNRELSEPPQENPVPPPSVTPPQS
ncbi:MAG: hypothetical protein QOJ63_2033 [Solirubrobacteraceae bacterium]|jgi:hypothetical protein|nr:hypothetical protein [Solirubrobacteraceae bacterium]